MTDLSDKIAAEHRRIWNTVWITCRCGWSNTEPPVADRDAFLAHVADVTERAVRETIAQQLENLEHDREAINHSARHGFGTEWAEGHDHAIRRASRIAREGTTP